MQETVTWLTTEAPPMFIVDVPVRSGGITQTYRDVHGLTIADCRMSWADSLAMLALGREIHTAGSSHLALLGDLDYGGIHVQPGIDNSWLIQIGPRLDKPPIQVTTAKGKIDTIRTAILPARNENDGKRVVEALKRAAVLCGAPVSAF
jgi:hypothetical protein